MKKEQIKTVADILNEKGGEVISTTPETTLADVCKILHGKNIGVALVKDQKGALLGVISERDIIRGIAEQGLNILCQKVGDLMTRKLVVCRPDTPLDAVLGSMTGHCFRHLPVMDGEQLLGMISIRDVVKTRLADLESEAKFMREYIQGITG
ncbi:MAG: CBS domain-containing protein [Magnetococcus sp. DMHC-1]|nr:CBS domain-containing protein [Magnetococcales bacterium]